jgi:hypothetical protein
MCHVTVSVSTAQLAELSVTVGCRAVPARSKIDELELEFKFHISEALSLLLGTVTARGLPQC